MSTATATRERGIIFSAPMVRAILEGRKTQTRRLVKHQGRPLADFAFYEVDGDEIRTESGRTKTCPYGRVGDRMWVRETWMQVDDQFGAPHIAFRADDTESLIGWDQEKGDHLLYAPVQAEWGAPSDDADKKMYLDDSCPWRSPIHMPRWASRITLEITDVRVQRVQEISPEDATAEGVSTDPKDYAAKIDGKPVDVCFVSPQYAFCVKWNELHGNGAWSRNPFVWAITFKRVVPERA